MKDEMMKRLLLSLLLPFLALLLSMGAVAATPNPSSNPVAVKHVFGVHGLTCPFCAVGIKKTFKKIKGVQSVNVSLKHGRVTVYTNKGVCFSKEELKQLFKKTGFTYHGTIVKPKSCQ